LKIQSYIYGMRKKGKKVNQMSIKNQYNMNNVQFKPEGQLKEINVQFSHKAQLGRPVDPNSARQKRLATAPGRKTGRPVNPNSVRQQRLAELEAKRIANGGTIKRGRPVNMNSERQKRLAELAAKRAAGTLKRGRPVGSGKKVNTVENKPMVNVVIMESDISAPTRINGVDV
jgi:hypothetical protein